jgi:hypothetical protein
MAPERPRLELVGGTARRIALIEAAPSRPPFDVQAIALEEDTSLVLSASAAIREDADEHPIRTMTALYDHVAHAPGEVIVRGRNPYRFLAIVHDLDQEPSWREAWVSQALAEILRLCDAMGIAALGLEPLGAKHGRLPRARFRELLEASRPAERARRLQRIWLLRPDLDAGS